MLNEYVVAIKRAYYVYGNFLYDSWSFHSCIKSDQNVKLFKVNFQQATGKIMNASKVIFTKIVR